MAIHAFSEKQASHANQALLNLIKTRRFFLYHPEHEHFTDKFKYHFDRNLFRRAVDLDKQIIEIHEQAANQGNNLVIQREEKLGVTQPSEKNQRILYTIPDGGLRICAIYPITAFANFLPDSLEALKKNQFDQIMGDDTEDDLSPKQVRENRETSNDLASKIWKQLKFLDIRGPQNTKCVVILKTDFPPYYENSVNGDLLQGKLNGIETYPYALGFLFHAYSQKNRIIPHGHTIFSSSKDSHVNMQHWANGGPSIDYAHKGGYSCIINLAIIL